ncbi:MAG: ABC transporter ATP-binding protein/permease [Schleiferiaceae bacterium]|jgi:ABC-type bacteriocin/lantibiotic exporter with double-glycine peptidase domain|nr:ABC transporter ATP-binding protein/permease [Schleiferiaceae bacterium]
MNKKITPMGRLWLLLKPDSLDIRNIYIYAIFSGLVSLSLPLGIQAIVNLIQGGEVSASWILLVTIVVLGVAISGIFQILQLRITERLQQKIFARAAFEFAYRIPKIKLEQLYKKYAPELMNRFFDTLTVQKGLPKILIDFTAAALQVIFGLLLLSFYHPFFIVFSLVLALLVVAIVQFTAKPGMRTSLEESKHKYTVAYWLEEIARAAPSFKLAGQTRLPLNKTNNRVDNYLDARNDHFKILMKQYALMVAYKVIVVAGLLGIGGILVFDQAMNIGQFIAAEIIILLVVSSVDKLIQTIETIYDVLTALEKIAQVTELEIESDEGIHADEEIKEEAIDVTLRDISFRYSDKDEPTLKGFNLKIKAGETIALTGSNGSGKTTLLNILAGVYQPDSGSVLYGDIPYNNMEPESIRNLTGSYLEEEIIFEGTVLENITLGRDIASIENVKWAIEKTKLTEFVHGLKDGYNTILDPLNQGLPKSIVQKILLARAIVIKPKILFLEQPLKHLDVNERNELIDFLVSKENPWTLVAITSMSYFAIKADKTLVLHKGELLSFEKFDDLDRIIDLEDHAEHIKK